MTLWPHFKQPSVKENNLSLLNYKLEGGDNTIQMQERLKHLLTPTPNVTVEAMSWQAENPDEHLVRLMLWKELMKRCFVLELLTFGNLGPLHCPRSLGLLHRQKSTADGEFMEQPQMDFCNWTQLLFWIPSGVCPLHPNQLFRSCPIWWHRSIRVLPGVQYLSIKLTLVS